VTFNIDGVSWLYEGLFDAGRAEMRLVRALVGEGELSEGTLDRASYDRESDRFALSFSTATSPTQLYILAGADRAPAQLTRERFLGIPRALLSPGEDRSFISFDGRRISARLYRPSAETGHSAPYPLVYYIHGGPQSQERPNFAWFSMPLIQFLTLNGFAVFTPNARGSTGYGLSYMKAVDHDWGGADRIDHLEAMKMLAGEPEIDISRAAVIGRSYGGFMTLTLAGRHPELWSAAVDMFGPYDLGTFLDRLPQSWKPYMALQVGDPETERDFLIERSPSTHIDRLACPLLVVQGQNDPRVIERESRDLVERLRAGGKDVEYLVFDNEGHDVLKLENRVRCYTAITDFFKRHLSP
jgi:dipeptidyl aminopeptidase/acylaminoacyl peptidase